MLKIISVGRRVVEEDPNTKREVQRQWEIFIGLISENLEKLRQVGEKATENRSETIKFIATVRHAARNIALKETFEALKGTDPPDSAVNEVFSKRCQAAVYELTRNTRDTERRLQEQFEREERDEARRRSERLLDLGLNLLGGGVATGSRTETCHSTSSFVYGMHRTCYYKCPSGTVTSTVGASQMCPLTRSIP